ncbi:glycosyltransferase family 4 protein [bacterium]|nr:glycosyltransferase family 4 protein [bacterium]
MLHPMKILTVAGWMYPDAEGGSYRVVYEAARGLARRGHEVHVATQRLDAEHPERETLDGIHVHRYATGAPRGLRFYRSTLREVRTLVNALQAEVRFDAVMSHHPVSAYAALRAKSIKTVPWLSVLHSLYFLEYLDRHSYAPRTGKLRPPRPFRRLIAALLKRMDTAVLDRSDRVAVLSDFTRSLVERHCPRFLAVLRKTPGGADLDTFRPEPTRADARQTLGIETDGALFFTCRRLEHRMGVLELVDAAIQLEREGRKLLLVVAGRGALEPEVRGRAAGSDAVRLVGYVPEEQLRLYYRAADAFVLSTRALEGFGLVTAEALACGTPVIGTPVGATPELLAPLDERLLTAGASAAELAQGMARFLDEVNPEPGLSERCRAYAEAHLSWEHMVTALERNLNEIVQENL